MSLVSSEQFDQAACWPTTAGSNIVLCIPTKQMRIVAVAYRYRRRRIDRTRVESLH